MVQFYKNQYGMVVDASGNVVTDKSALQQASGNAQGTEAAKTAISALPTYTPMTQGGAVDAAGLSAPTSLNTPTPTAPGASETFQVGLQAGVQSATTNLEKTLKQERDAALKRQDQLNKQLLAIQQESDPTKRETFAQEERIIQNQLDAAETASATLEEDFTKRRSTVGELERLLTEGNDLITRSKNAPVALSVLNKSVNRTIQDVQARAGVLQAVLSGVDGNIAQAHNIINTAQGTVRTYWQDEVEYNNAYLNLVNNGELAKNKIHDDYAKSQVDLAEHKLNQLDETSDYIKKLMIDPSTAQFIADAGVTLNDSVEEINAKLSEQNRKNEVNDVINDLKLEGYKFVPFGEGRSDAVMLEIAGEQLYFVPPPETATGGSGSGGFTSQERRKLEQAGLAGASRQEQLDFLYGDDTISPSVALTPTQERELISVGLLAGDIKQIQQDVSEFGLDETLKGIDNEQQRNAVAKAYGRETTTTPATPEEVEKKIVSTLQGVQSTYTRSEAEDLARANLEKALGVDSLPASFETALQDALVEVYGRTFWQAVLPGGR